jgi:hypothetical protein
MKRKTERKKKPGNKGAICPLVNACTGHILVVVTECPYVQPVAPMPQTVTYTPPTGDKTLELYDFPDPSGVTQTRPCICYKPDSQTR